MRFRSGFLLSAAFAFLFGCDQFDKREDLRSPERLKITTTSPLFKTKYNTIAHRILDIEKDFDITEADYRELDSIVDAARVKLKSAERRLVDGTTRTGTHYLDGDADLHREAINDRKKWIEECIDYSERAHRIKSASTIQLAEEQLTRAREMLAEGENRARAKISSEV